MSIITPEIGWLEVGAEGAPGSYGTKASDFETVVPVEAPEVDEQFEEIARETVKPTADALPSAFVETQTTISGTVEVAGPPVSDTDQEPSVSPLLRAAGLSETITGDTNNKPIKAEYSILESGHDSMTVQFYRLDKDTGNWLKWEILGCRCSVDFEASIHSRLLMNFEATGLYTKATKETSPTVPTDTNNGVPPLQVEDITMTNGASLNQNITNFTFNPNRTVQEHNRITASESLDEATVMQGDPAGGSFDPRQTMDGWTATGGMMDEVRAEGLNQLKFEISLASGGNTYKWFINGETAQLKPPSNEAEEDMMRFDTPYMYTESTPGAGNAWTMTLQSE